MAAFALASRHGRAAAPASGAHPERQRCARGPRPSRPSSGQPRGDPAPGWLAVLRQVWDENSKDNMTIVAAGCAFYAMLALFPAITALVSIYGLVADPQQVEQQVSAMQGVLPDEAAALIATQAQAVASGTTGVLGWGAALAIAFALWTAASGVKALFTALNIAYEEEETRGLIRFNLDALLFTLLMIVGVVVGLGVIVGLPAALDYLPARSPRRVGGADRLLGGPARSVAGRARRDLPLRPEPGRGALALGDARLSLRRRSCCSPRRRRFRSTSPTSTPTTRPTARWAA